MRFFLSLLAPLFLSFACAEQEYFYSVSWETPVCTTAEELAVLGKMTGVVNEVLEAANLPTVDFSYDVAGESSEQDRRLCDMSRCFWPGCYGSVGCSFFFNCDECGSSRELRQTSSRYLTHRELKTLEEQIVSTCSDALTQLTLDGYTQECRNAMAGAECSAIVYSDKSYDVMTTSDCSRESTTHAVCSNAGVKYAVHAGDKVTFDGVVSSVDGGYVGVSPGTSITMVEPLAQKGGGITTGGTSNDFAYYVNTAHEEATKRSPDMTTDIIEIGGETYSPGVYHFESAINIAAGSSVTLDGPGEYIFQAGTTLTTAADTFFILLNGAKADEVLWVLGSSATIGTRSVVEGSILSGVDITFNAQAELRGCALAKGAVTFSSSGSVNLKSQPSPICSPQTLAQGVCENYAIHSRTGVTFADGGTISGGDVGVSPAPVASITGVEEVTFEYGGVAAYNAATEFAKSVVFSHSAATAHRVNTNYLGPSIELGGLTIFPGTHRAGTAMNLAATTVVTLDANGDPDAKFVFQAGTTLITGANSKVILINGTKADNVLWSLGSAATLGTNSVVEGSILAGTAISFGDNSHLHGCALALAEITFSSPASVSTVHS
jgi:hypothetical protein